MPKQVKRRPARERIVRGPELRGQDVSQVVVVSDTHCGCKLGLCPPDGIVLDDGGPYHLGPTQQFIWHHWMVFWREWVPQVTKGERFAVVHNGDLTEGVVKQSTTPISANLGDQAKIAKACMRPIVDLCDGLYYQVRGTEAHVGKAAVEEERIGEELGAIPNKHAQHARYEIWKQVGDGLVHFAHHIGVTSSTHHEASAVNAELTKMYVEAARWSFRPPDIVCRSHRHRYCEVLIPVTREERGEALAHRQRGRCVVTPSWQGKTPFAHRTNRVSPPQFGGLLIKWSGRELYTESYCVSFKGWDID